MNPVRAGLPVLCLNIVLLGPPYLRADDGGDWPGWRGPRRDGAGAEFVPPRRWPAELRTVWRHEVGAGHSSPVVKAERVYLHTRQGEEEVVRGIELSTGRELWRQSYGVHFKTAMGAGRHGKGPKSTPVAAESHLYTLGITGVLSAWDLESGVLVWRRDSSHVFAKTGPRFGTATSPLVDSGRLIVHLGGHGDGALLALDAKSGEELWRFAEDGPSYASPIVVDLAGVPQVVTQTEESVVGVDVESGRLLWRFPFGQNLFHQNIVTPVLYRDAIVTSGEKRGTLALRPFKEGDVWRVEELWHNRELSMHMSSPVVRGDRIIGLSHRDKGRLFCLDGRTGEIQWRSPARTAENASLVAVDGALLVLTEAADLLVVEDLAQRFTVVARYRVAQSPTWAHPALLKRRILVKDADTVTLLSFGE